MKKYRLISNYTVKQYKVHKSKCNEEKIDNVVHREIVGYSAGPNKDAKLVYEAFIVGVNINSPKKGKKIPHLWV